MSNPSISLHKITGITIRNTRSAGKDSETRWRSITFTDSNGRTAFEATVFAEDNTNQTLSFEASGTIVMNFDPTVADEEEDEDEAQETPF